MATLGGGVFVALTRRDDEFDERLDQLRRQIMTRTESWELRAVTRRPVRVWLEPLPASHEESVLTLRRLSRENR